MNIYELADAARNAADTDAADRASARRAQLIERLEQMGLTGLEHHVVHAQIPYIEFPLAGSWGAIQYSGGRTLEVKFWSAGGWSPAHRFATLAELGQLIQWHERSRPHQEVASCTSPSTCA